MAYHIHEHSYVVGGLGVTGQACVRFLLAQHAKVKAFDTRPTFSLPEDLLATMQDDVVTASEVTKAYFNGVDTLILSPGLAPTIEQVALAKECGVEVIGDIELFARLNRSARHPKKLVGITGSNGKTTVTLLVNHLLNACGVSSIEAGNVGRPVLEALDSDVDVVVLELSSFQLETTTTLPLCAATILNISDDHLDRHGTLENYIQAKQRIFNHAQSAVVWRDGIHISPDTSHAATIDNVLEYGLGACAKGFSIKSVEGKQYIAFNQRPLIAIQAIHLAGMHNVLNVMAALAICHELGVSPEAAVQHIGSFHSAPHRCVEVARIEGVRYIDDSKATNIGATIAALEGLAPTTEGHIILIAGGDAKGANLATLTPYLNQHVTHVFALGKDAQQFKDCFAPTTLVSSMEEAVAQARQEARDGDVVLLSPACASLDMFDNYMHRGDVFARAVHALLLQATAL
ncbi:UDP-N-acetylmuramoyl-L-alanine--D-glutamate ligase [Alteromonas sp. D210916BOD_24]|uniref:UDP-N-acetylmuramoyl-L-alanine--D-glutamate ligase n=1 Tax=Alteromonas sp. D210916BOD_24 TaxID=3157618 RepID=UPI00399D057B